MKYDLETLQNRVYKKLIRIQYHPVLPLLICKYTEDCVYSKSWDYITMNMRGTVLDEDGNRVSNPFPKFFNIDELEAMGVSLPDLPYKVYNKFDGSLIQVFNYKGELVVSSLGSFISSQAITAKNMLLTKYPHLVKLIQKRFPTDKTYIFELIDPTNKIVVQYGEESKLILLAIRDNETGREIPYNLTFAKDFGFDIAEEINMNLEEIKQEIKRPDFINKEGFVIKYESGFRVKCKYSEYFRLHKILSDVNEKFVWEFVSQGKSIDLKNIPDETFQFIKETESMLKGKFHKIWHDILDISRTIKIELDSQYETWGKKEYALKVISSHKQISHILFLLYDHKLTEAKKAMWKMIEPKYEKGISAF